MGPSLAYSSPVGVTPQRPSTAAFQDWCKSTGIKTPGLTISHSSTTGRCVVATRNIKEGEVVVEVPDAAVLMAESSCIAAELEDAGLAKDTAEDALFEVQGLILAVMAERLRGKESPWDPYLSFLPDSFDHMPFMWTPDQQKELRGTCAMDKMEGHVQAPADAPTRVRQLWEDIAWPFLSAHPHLLAGLGKKKGAVQKERGWALYCWATGAVASYSFVLGDDQFHAMVPYWDALNHITGYVNVRLNHHTGRGGKGALQMIATRDIAAGEEIINNYGELSQAELLRGYGYVERHDRAEMYCHAQVPLRFLVAAAAHVSSQRKDGAKQPGSERQNGKKQGRGTSKKAQPGGGGDSDTESLGDFGLDSSESESEEQGDLGVKGAPNSAAKKHQPAAQRETEEEKAGQRVGPKPRPSAKKKQPAADAAEQAEQQQVQEVAGNKRKRPTSTQADAPTNGVVTDATPPLPDASVIKRSRHDHQSGPLLTRFSASKVHRHIPGLADRLEFLRHVGLLSEEGVYKVPRAKDGQSCVPRELIEASRILLLPLEDFEQLVQRVQDWQPDKSAQQTGAGAAKVNLKQGSTQQQPGTDEGNSSEPNPRPQPLVDVGPLHGAEVAACLRTISQHMLSRYTGPDIKSDEQLLETAARQRQQQAQPEHAAAAGDTGDASKPAVSGKKRGKAGQRQQAQPLQQPVGDTSTDGQAAAGNPEQPQQPQPPQEEETVPGWLEAAVVARLGEKQCLHELLECWAPGQEVEQQVQQVALTCWAAPRPGMHGVPPAGTRQGGDSDDESEEEGEDEEEEGGGEEDDSLSGMEEDEEDDEEEEDKQQKPRGQAKPSSRKGQSRVQGSNGTGKPAGQGRKSGSTGAGAKHASFSFNFAM